MSAWREFLAEARRPSGAGETAYEWAVIQCGHAMLGMGAGALAGWAGYPGLAMLAGPMHYAIKELGDLRRGGSRLDGLADTGFVAAGAVLALAPLAAPLVLAAVAAGITLRRPRPDGLKPWSARK